MSVNSIGNTGSILSTMTAVQTQAHKPLSGKPEETAAQQKQPTPEVQAGDGKLGNRIDTFA